MALRFSKDLWIIDALNKGYLKVDYDGTIRRLRHASVALSGMELTSDLYDVVKPRVHKKSGRVYFNMTWRGFTKSVLVNRVVAWAFLPNPLDLPQVNHRDGNKENNAIGNLEWSTGHDNEKHAHRTGLKSGRGTSNSNARLVPAQVLEIRASADPIPVLMERYDVARSTIINILNRTTWSHL